MSDTTSTTEKRKVSFVAPDEDRAVSRHELSRYLAEELGAERREEIEAALAADETLAAELRELKAERDAFFVSMPFDRFVADHEERRAPAGGFAAFFTKLRWQLGGGFLAASAAAALFIVVAPNGPHDGPDVVDTGDGHSAQGQNRTKGASRIGLFVREAAGARLGVDGEKLTAGDQIQFMVKDAPDASARVILGIDGKGSVTVYSATAFTQGTAKGAADGAPEVIGSSVVLDDAVGAERFFVVYGDADVEALAGMAQAAVQALVVDGADLSRVDRLPLDERFAQSSIHIVKVPN